MTRLLSTLALFACCSALLYAYRASEPAVVLVCLLAVVGLWRVSSAICGYVGRGYSAIVRFDRKGSWDK